jgi:hypothetical protein
VNNISKVENISNSNPEFKNETDFINPIFMPISMSVSNNIISNSEPQSTTNLATATTVKNTLSLKTSTFIDKENFPQATQIKSLMKSSSFKAKPVPNFTFLEVKKSSHVLTTPKSPPLMTKSRSMHKLNK